MIARVPRGLDHIVHAVRDLDAAARAYQRLGFTVGALNRHPWGTHNRIVQFPGFFIEILTLAEPDKLDDDGFSERFGRFNGNFAERHEGFSMLILESANATADAVDFRTAGIATSAALRFEREGRRPDGSPVKVAFSLAFAGDPEIPQIGMAVCQQHYPENFWNPAYQQHSNGATGVLGMVIVASEPARHARTFAAFAGTKADRKGPGEIQFATPRGDITLLTPAVFEDRFGVAAPDVSDAARLAALRLAGGRSGQSDVIAADQLFGATLVWAATKPL